MINSTLNAKAYFTRLNKRVVHPLCRILRLQIFVKEFVVSNFLIPPALNFNCHKMSFYRLHLFAERCINARKWRYNNTKQNISGELNLTCEKKQENFLQILKNCSKVMLQAFYIGNFLVLNKNIFCTTTPQIFR